MPVFLLSSSALVLGVIHGLGLDHLMAIATLSIEGHSGPPRGTRIVRTAMQFALGHMVVLGVGAAAALALGWTLPAAMAEGAERIGGVVLIALGGAGLWTLAAGRAYGHLHEENDGRTRWHFHLGRKLRHRGAHSHSNVATVMGAAFAVSSLRALVMLAPMGVSLESFSPLVVLLLIALFGLGILLSMSIFGVVLARVWSLKAVAALGRAAGLAVAGASVTLGVYWILG